MDTIEKIDAIEAIKIVKAKYFRFLDTKDWEGLRSIFTPDAVLDIPEAASGSKTIDEALPFIQSVVEGAVSIHFGHMPEIEVLSENAARGIWAMDDRIYWPEDKAQVLGYARLRGFGHYHETYERLDGEWRIKTMRLTRLRLVTQKPPLAVS